MSVAPVADSYLNCFWAVCGLVLYLGNAGLDFL